LFTVIVHSGRVAAPEGTGINPESMPRVGVVWRTHGLGKVDWVTEWFFPWNWKETVSPAAAVIWLGLKMSALLAPTCTRKFFALTTAMENRTVATREKRIVSYKN